jgi:hypothetical protein
MDHPPRVGYVVHGTGGLHPATAHIRVTRPLNRAVVAGVASSLQIDPGEPLPDVDVVLVQRDAVPLAATSAFSDAVRRSGVPLVVDVDDDFFGPEARARLARAEYGTERIAAVEAMVRAADTVTVSTPVLRDVVAPMARQVVVVPNELDPEFWIDGAVAPAPGPDDGVVRALYAGSATHGDDLALLRDAFDGLVLRDGRAVRLEVVGVHDGTDDDWYDRLVIPDGWTHYPEYVRWMRANAGRWSVGVAPLTDTAFNRAKSDIKALDYALLGLPVVASDGPAYRPLGRYGVRLVRDAATTAVGSSARAWRDAVRSSVERAGGERFGRTARLRRHTLRARMLGSSGAWERALFGRC